MTDRLAERRRLVASLPSGPRAPIATTPPRRPGSVRRTMAVDQRCAMPGEPSVIQASGRDLVTGLDGTATVLDEATLVLGLDATGSVASVDVAPPVPALDALVGTHARSGFRARAAELAPEQRAGATVLHQLLDDVPLAALIASYGMTREHPEWEIPPAAVERLGDLCAGWAFGATMLSTTLDLGIFPVPIGPSLPVGAGAGRARRRRRSTGMAGPGRDRTPVGSGGCAASTPGPTPTIRRSPASRRTSGTPTGHPPIPPTGTEPRAPVRRRCTSTR
ncbi:MAG: hypothetical protein U0P45_14705 [Acidimicrobiales bacterium]